MKLNYYKYYLDHVPTSDKIFYNIKDFLISFAGCEVINPLKNNIRFGYKNYYLLHITEGLFLFLSTSDVDLIKRIDKDNITADDIHDLLSDNQSIGFASYVYIRDNCIGIASPPSSPKITSFVRFINQLFIVTNNQDYEIIAQPLLIEPSSKEEVFDLSMIGKTRIEVGTENSLCEDFLAFLGLSDDDILNIASIELTIKPQRQGNIKNASKLLLDRVSDADLRKLIISAKDEATDKLIDYYIEGKGIISDAFSYNNEENIAAIIELSMRENSELQRRLGQNNEEIQQNNIIHISAYNNVTAWANVTNILQSISSS